MDCRRGDAKFSVWHVTFCDHVIRVVQLHYGFHFIIRLNPAKFGGRMVSEGRSILFLVFHVTLCDQVFRETCDFMGALTSPYVPNFPSFIAIDLAKEDLLQPRCQRIMWLLRWVTLTICYQSVMFGSHRTCRRVDIKFSVCQVTSRNHMIRRRSDITDEFPSS